MKTANDKASFMDYITVAVNVFSMILTGRFILLLSVFFVISTFSAYNGYNKLEKLDNHYHYTDSAEYIKLSSDKCTMVFDRETLEIVRDLGGFNSWEASNCNEVMADTQYIKALIVKHDSDVRPITKFDTFFIQAIVFFVYVCVCVVNLRYPANTLFPASSYAAICAGWVLISALAFPFTYQSYGTTTIFDDADGQTIGMSDGRITSDGQWMYMPRTFMGKVMNISYPQAL